MHPYDPDPDTPAPLWLNPCAEALKITYEIDHALGVIKFQPCGYMSWRKSDVEKRYCPFCDRYMDLIEAAREVVKKYGSSVDSGQPG